MRTFNEYFGNQITSDLIEQLDSFVANNEIPADMVQQVFLEELLANSENELFLENLMNEGPFLNQAMVRTGAGVGSIAQGFKDGWGAMRGVLNGQNPHDVIAQYKAKQQQQGLLPQSAQSQSNTNQPGIFQNFVQRMKNAWGGFNQPIGAQGQPQPQPQPQPTQGQSQIEVPFRNVKSTINYPSKVDQKDSISAEIEKLNQLLQQAKSAGDEKEAANIQKHLNIQQQKLSGLGESLTHVVNIAINSGINRNVINEHLVALNLAVQQLH